MKRVFSLFPFVSMLALTIACGGDDDDNSNDNSSSGSISSSSSSGAGASSSSSSGGSSSSSGGSSSSSGGSSGVVPFACEDTPFAFPADASPVLAAAAYADYLTVSSTFPFDVVGLYGTDADIQPGASGWDESGKLYSLDVDVDTGAIGVDRLGIPGAATGTLTHDALSLPAPSDLFEPAYLNYPAVASLPGNQYVLSYTSTAVGGVVPGLAYLFEGSTQKSKAFSNGIFAQVGAVRADATRVFYSAFSRFEAVQSATNASGIYASDVVAQQLAGATSNSFLLMATAGDSSGPVVKDASGSLVATSLGAKVNVRAMSRCAALEATTTQDVPVLHSYDETGTQSLAVIPATATQPGYVVFLAYVAPYGAPPGTQARIVATPFTRTGNVFATSGADLEQPLAMGPDGGYMNVFSDYAGYLWVSVTTDADGTKVLKLRRRSN